MPESKRTFELADILVSAAKQRRLVPYPRLHKLFVSGEPPSYRYEILSYAAQTIADCRLLDYSCLMALANGLPGDDFFLRFKGKRRDEFDRIMGSSCGKSIIKRRELVTIEREKVFAHAIGLIEVVRPQIKEESAAASPPLRRSNQSSMHLAGTRGLCAR